MTALPVRHYFQQQQQVQQMFYVDPIIIQEPEDSEGIEMKGRNSRKPKLSNHGARPCSSYMRRLKLKGWYHKLRGD